MGERESSSRSMGQKKHGWLATFRRKKHVSGWSCDESGRTDPPAGYRGECHADQVEDPQVLEAEGVARRDGRACHL